MLLFSRLRLHGQPASFAQEGEDIQQLPYLYNFNRGPLIHKLLEGSGVMAPYRCKKSKRLELGLCTVALVDVRWSFSQTFAN